MSSTASTRQGAVSAFQQAPAGGAAAAPAPAAPAPAPAAPAAAAPGPQKERGNGGGAYPGDTQATILGRFYRMTLWCNMI